MANRLRFRSGMVQLIKVRVNSSTVIEAGDLVFLDTNNVKSARDFTWNTNLVTTQGGFAEVFLGIAHQPSTVGKTEPISVDISPFSVYEFDVPGTSYEVGELLGPDSISTMLMNQQLEKVGSNAAAIARSIEFHAGNTNHLRVSFASAFHTGSANVNAVLG